MSVSIRTVRRTNKLIPTFTSRDSWTRTYGNHHHWR